MSSKYSKEYLSELQGYPLSIKIQLTKQRIREWVHRYGEDGVYVSFSGGKDSTVLLHLVREMYPDVPAVFVDTGLEYPEIRQFVRTFDNVTWLKPKKNFRKIIEEYGYPFISKEVSQCVYFANKYQSEIDNGNTKTKKYKWAYDKVIGTGLFDKTSGYANYSKKRYKFFLEKEAPMISSVCCQIMKKEPLHHYDKKNNRVPFTAEMASESQMRTNAWMKNGCNGFDTTNPKSTPMAFWTEQDVLLYIWENHIPIASVYGEVVKENEVVGQLDFDDLGIFDMGRPIFKTTGCQRTGCMFCGYGCHLDEKGQGRFLRLKTTHPKIYDYIMRPWEEGGLNYKEVIDWINEHGNLHIEY